MFALHDSQIVVADDLPHTRQRLIDGVAEAAVCTGWVGSSTTFTLGPLVRTWQGASLPTASAPLPIHTRLRPPRPCVPITIRSMLCCSAYLTISDAAVPTDKARTTSIPARGPAAQASSCASESLSSNTSR